jgi:nucleoside-diphosphate-sugar epimerase
LGCSLFNKNIGTIMVLGPVPRIHVGRQSTPSHRGALIFLLGALTIASWSGECWALSTSTPQHSTKTLSIVTGANGFVGKQIVKTLLENNSLEPGKDNNAPDDHCVVCLVRPHRVETEQKYWGKHKTVTTTSKQQKSTIVNQQSANVNVCVMPYDMTDGGATLKNALEQHTASSLLSTNSSSEEKNDDKQKTANNLRVHVYHVASVFGPTEDHRQTALDNVQGTKDVVQTLAEWYLKKRRDEEKSSDVVMSEPPRLVLTSSMAAVRGTGQIPANTEYYTNEDWNTLSELGGNWGTSYQWSKAESERVAWEECRRYNDDGDVLEMTSLCPSFVFGPVDVADEALSTSYSIELVQQWMDGASPVQSRLCVDVRDVAQAHVAAANSPQAKHQRYVCSSEARIPSQEIAEALKSVLSPEAASAVLCDTTFSGGAIPIGQKEVATADHLKQDLGVKCRPVTETFVDMAQSLLQHRETHKQT